MVAVFEFEGDRERIRAGKFDELPVGVQGFTGILFNLESKTTGPAGDDFADGLATVQASEGALLRLNVSLTREVAQEGLRLFASVPGPQSPTPGCSITTLLPLSARGQDWRQVVDNSAPGFLLSTIPAGRLNAPLTIPVHLQLPGDRIAAETCPGLDFSLDVVDNQDALLASTRVELRLIEDDVAGLILRGDRVSTDGLSQEQIDEVVAAVNPRQLPVLQDTGSPDAPNQSVLLSPGGEPWDEGSVFAIGLSLSSEPEYQVTVDLFVDGEDSVPAGRNSTLSVQSMQFTPSNWNVPQLSVLTTVPDGLFDSSRSALRVSALVRESSADPVYSSLATATHPSMLGLVFTPLADVDRPGIRINPQSLIVVGQEELDTEVGYNTYAATAESIILHLETAPLHPVTIRFSTDNAELYGLSVSPSSRVV